MCSVVVTFLSEARAAPEDEAGRRAHGEPPHSLNVFQAASQRRSSVNTGAIGPGRRRCRGGAGVGGLRTRTSVEEDALSQSRFISPLTERQRETEVLVGSPSHRGRGAAQI